MSRRYLAFDIEITKVLPAGSQDWAAYRPLGVSCAATFSGEGQPLLWHGRAEGAAIADQMSRDEAAALVKYLADSAAHGLTILTWNGLGFDFDILAEESGETSVCRQLALDHVDMMFHLFCLLGYALGLDRVARGMGLPGKPPGMSGELAPIYWSQGRRWEVLNYVAQDARTTLEIALAAEARGALSWSSRQGIRQELTLPQGWLSVREAMVLPQPDTSWMKQPWPRSKFTGWLDAR
jgi:hypothetical protein